jgi:hypothetical protein
MKQGRIASGEWRIVEAQFCPRCRATSAACPNKNAWLRSAGRLKIQVGNREPRLRTRRSHAAGVEVEKALVHSSPTAEFRSIATGVRKLGAGFGWPARITKPISGSPRSVRKSPVSISRIARAHPIGQERAKRPEGLAVPAKARRSAVLAARLRTSSSRYASA